eukprot:1139379-Pelagomonas_calceolata.AAC.2
MIVKTSSPAGDGGGTSPNAIELRDALDGNLCRCTGYRPIVDACKCAHSHPLHLIGKVLASVAGVTSYQSILSTLNSEQWVVRCGVLVKASVYAIGFLACARNGLFSSFIAARGLRK